MNALTIASVWCKRFRKRKGYGVHSPFAFSFIKGVICEQTAYYAYDEIECGKRCSFLSPRYHERKIERLLFRLANFVQPELVVAIGATTRELAYLEAGCRRAKVVSLTSQENEIDLNLLMRLSEMDLLYIAQPTSDGLTPRQFDELMGSSSMVIVKSIGGHEGANRQWNSLLSSNGVGVSFDLYYLGIALFKHEICREQYIVNF